MGIIVLLTLLWILELAQLYLKIELCHYEFKSTTRILSKLDDQKVGHYLETYLSLGSHLYLQTYFEHW